MFGFGFHLFARMVASPFPQTGHMVRIYGRYLSSALTTIFPHVFSPLSLPRNPCIGSTDSSESEDSETTSEDEAESFESDTCDKSLGLRAVDSVQCTQLPQSEHQELSKKFDELHWDKSTHYGRGVNNLTIETLADGELESAKGKKTMWQMVTDRSNLKKREESKGNKAKEIEEKQIYEPPKLEDRPDVGDLPDRYILFVGPHILHRLSY